jgi:hypothetical protein
MNGLAARVVQLSSAFALLLTVGSVMTSHAARPAAKAPQGLPTDWTHRHVVFSQPRTLEQMKRVGSEARYWQQFDRRVAVREVVQGPVSQIRRYIGPRPGQLAKMKRDWSVSLGSGGSVGAGNFPAKYAFKTDTADCNNDYVTFATGLLSSGTQASIVGYNNLYSTCASATIPSTYWAYNTGGTVLTSPVLSQDGTQISFVQTSAGAASLVLLKWAAGLGTATAPTPLTSVAAASYSACAAPCMTLIALQDNHGGAVDDTTSSVFYDYGHDVAWVGSTGGWLHKITPAFKGTGTNPPQEVRTGGFPVQVNLGATPLSSPVSDFVSGNVFVGDIGGFLYRVDGSTGAFTASGQLDFGVGLVSGPILDPTSELLYVFASNNGTTNCTGHTGPCSSVYVFPTNFPAGSVETDIAVGGSVPAPSPLYEGSFDNAYQNSPNATGNLYVCGNTGQRPIIYQIPINNGVMGPVVTGPALSTGTANCSPLTDVYNPNTPGGASEWVFAGPSTLGFGNNCNTETSGCIISFKTTAWMASTPYVVGQEILDPNFQIQVVQAAGTSGAGTPAWSTTTGGTTTDGGVTWLNQSKQSPSHGFWFALHPFATNTFLVDSNNNIEWLALAGVSGVTTPVWSTIVGGTTPDGAAFWENLGPIATYSLAANGGVSGIIIDNVVNASGNSQVYFTTLSDQACGTGGTGGCAIQASQSALQ